MSASEIQARTPAEDHELEGIPSVGRVALVGAVSVVGAVAIVTLGLIAMVLVGILAGLLIVFGALPLWGWACVQNKALYS
jgi:hypothetical protein